MRLRARTRVRGLGEAGAVLVQIFGVERRLRSAWRGKARRRAHIDDEMFDRRKFRDDSRKDARGVMRLYPHLEKFRRHGKMGDIVGELRQLKPQKPGGIGGLAKLGFQPAAYDAPGFFRASIFGVKLRVRRGFSIGLNFDNRGTSAQKHRRQNKSSA